MRGADTAHVLPTCIFEHLCTTSHPCLQGTQALESSTNLNLALGEEIIPILPVQQQGIHHQTPTSQECGNTAHRLLKGKVGKKGGWSGHTDAPRPEKHGGNY